MIPKKLHFVWIGDEAKRPDDCINTWREKNPSYEVIVWGNEALNNYGWINSRHIYEMSKKELCGVADLMRYEILFREGGVTLDADSVCLTPLEDWLLMPDAFAYWEQEIARPGLISVGVMGSVPNNSFFGACIHELEMKETVVNGDAWQTTGPVHLTEVFHKTQYDLTIYPSHFFSRDHFTGKSYAGNGYCFATQLWGSTKGYGNIS